MRTIPFCILTLLTSVSFAQNINQSAVDTMTKDVAIAVFGKISQEKGQLKAQTIYTQLLSCSDGCDPQNIIRTVGSWDQVGAKMQELSELKNTATFIAMSPEDANVAIRKQLATFYSRYKADNNYGKPLNSAVQAQILAKIDQMLPPAVAPEPSPAVSESSTVSEAVPGNDIDPASFQISKLEREVKEREDKQLWMMIISGLVGLLVGAGAIYLLLYRAAQAELQALLDENNRLRNSLESFRRANSGNNVNSVRVDYRQKADAYDAIVKELDTDKPLVVIRQLKQQGSSVLPKSTPVARAPESFVEPVATPDPVQMQEPAPFVQTPSPIPAPARPRSEVFYFPPPDPNGQFDMAQKSSSLSPESAYRFSVSAEASDRESPSVASFRFEAEPGRVARFLTYRNYMIEPACESENSYTTTHTRITMRRDGTAMLENGVWRVKTKALIRYE
ncbi:hypothetical protein GO730_12995 [Spirosoma sp. HMF3257]|uniref:Uncharacterized protein n=2 Tax=Spirosoma telluris TaxID=2183553 RepID=A0A327NV23_9BACT|nr:hypothetical protein [Spirosoma telluris]RAI78443.1 hypothetical protein HMF3257_12910 [Spirosoma telluris]